MIAATSSEPENLKPDTVRAVAEDVIEIKFRACTKLLKKIEKVKGLFAHSHSNINMAELLDVLCELAIEKKDFAVKKRSQESTPAPGPVPSITNRVQRKPNLNQPNSIQSKCTKGISSSVKQLVWQRAKSQCQCCGSVHALQIDHIRPRVFGGHNAPENLRLLCRSCNQRAAINYLGVSKMQRHLEQ